MSRIGLAPITIEEGVTVTVDGKDVFVKGKLGELKVSLPWKLSVEIKDNIINVKRDGEDKETVSLHGSYRMFLANAVEGVSKGFVKNLEVVGVGYRARMEGTTLVMTLGYNHPIKFDAPSGITLEAPEEGKIIVKGIDKQKVGEVAAKIREIRKPEVYKGKGIRYEGEYVRKKNPKASIAAK